MPRWAPGWPRQRHRSRKMIHHPAGRRRSKPVYFRPSLEPLEDRTLRAGSLLARAVPLTFFANHTAAAAGLVRTADQVVVYSFQLQAGDQVQADVDAQQIGSGLNSLLRVFNAAG